jgi:amino acid transporter
MLVLEIGAIVAFTLFAAVHGHAQPADPITRPGLPGHGGALVGVGAGALLAAVVPALFAFNGYDWPLYFSEETRNARRTLPRAVLLAAGLCVLFEVAAVVAATYAIRDLPALTRADSPLSDLAHQVMGPVGATVLLAGVVVAMFDTGLAANLGYARIYFAAGRDRMWPGPVNGFFAHLGRRSQVPVYGFAVLFAGNGLLCVFSSLNALITFTGVVIVAVYLLVAVSALVVRVRHRHQRGTLRMPLWPLPPIVALLGIALALSQQKPRDLAITASIALIALLGYLLARRHLSR